MYAGLVGNGWVTPGEFWRMHPSEFWWLIEAKRPTIPKDPRILSRTRANELAEKLKGWMQDEHR
jgi:hypothetical protein